MSFIFPDLKYPPINIKLKQEKQRFMVFDVIRKKWLVLSPEEWVRQHILHWLIHQKNISPGFLSVEKELSVNGLKRRYDIVIYNTVPEPVMVIECKAPSVPLSEQTIEQALRYNMELGAAFCFISNGLEDLLFKSEKGKAVAVSDWPVW